MSERDFRTSELNDIVAVCLLWLRTGQEDGLSFGNNDAAMLEEYDATLIFVIRNNA